MLRALGWTADFDGVDGTARPAADTEFGVPPSARQGSGVHTPNHVVLSQIAGQRQLASKFERAKLQAAANFSENADVQPAGAKRGGGCASRGKSRLQLKKTVFKLSSRDCSGGNNETISCAAHPRRALRDRADSVCAGAHDTFPASGPPGDAMTRRCVLIAELGHFDGRRDSTKTQAVAASAHADAARPLSSGELTYVRGMHSEAAAWVAISSERARS
jgi:hypothetical protein